MAMAKIHKRILRFFSKIDSSGQMGPLINKALQHQHQVIPGPIGFERRSAKDVYRVQLLELYDADSFFSCQAVNRLQRMRVKLPGNAFLKLMEVLVAIFNVYMASKGDKHDTRVSRTKKLKMTNSNHGNNDQCDSVECIATPSVTFMGKPVNTLSNVNTLHGQGLQLCKFNSCSENVEKFKDTQTMRKKSQNRRVLSRGDNFSRRSNQAVESTTINHSQKEQVQEARHKDNSQSRSLKRTCPSSKGGTPSKNERRTGSYETYLSPPVNQCARFLAWRGNV